MSVVVRRADFEAADVFVIGGGPSLRDFDWTLLKGKPTIGCNAAFLLGCGICRVCFFSDLHWFDTFNDRLTEYPGMVVTHCPELSEKRPAWLHFVPRREPGLWVDGIGGGSSGAGAVNLALLLGARRILLLGFDGALAQDGRSNWHENTIEPPNPHVYPKFDEDLFFVAKMLPLCFPGREVINLTPNSTINHFPRGELRNFL